MSLYSRENKVVKYILLGFLIFGIKHFAGILFNPLQSVFALIGLILVFIYPVFNFKRLQTNLSSKINSIFVLYLFWNLLIVIRPLILNEEYTDNSLHPYSDYGIYSYLLPLVVFVRINIDAVRQIYKIIFIFSIIGFVFFVMNFNVMQATVMAGILNNKTGVMPIYSLANQYYFWFSISSLSLLSLEFIPKSLFRKFAIASSVFMLLLLLYFARRGGVFMFIVYFGGMFYMYTLKTTGIKRINSLLLILFIIIVGAVIIYLFSETTFSYFFNRLDDDTRTGVDVTIIEYLSKENAWIFGKGIEGAYYHPVFDEPRYTHETGYLYLILKGGMVNLILYVFLLLHSAFIGFFKTKNRFTKAFAIYVFLHVAFLIPYGLPSFSLEYLFVWIGFSLCESKRWRNLTDVEIKHLLYKKK